MKDIIELKTEDEWREAFPVLQTLRTDLTLSEFLGRREFLQSNGYHLFALKHEGKMVAVASADIYPHVTKEINCWVHDLATSESQRSKGFGKKLMRHIEQWAKGLGCARLCVHTRIEREAAQRFYEEKLGYPKAAMVYYKELDDV